MAVGCGSQWERMLWSVRGHNEAYLRLSETPNQGLVPDSVVREVRGQSEHNGALTGVAADV